MHVYLWSREVPECSWNYEVLKFNSPFTQLKGKIYVQLSIALKANGKCSVIKRLHEPTPYKSITNLHRKQEKLEKDRHPMSNYFHTDK